MKKKKLNSYLIAMFILFMALGAMLVELVLFIYQTITHEQDADAYVIVLCVMPALAVIITVWLIFFNHFTLSVSNKLKDGLNRISQGNFDVKIPYRRADAFNAVFADFNKMAEELKSVKTLREDFVREFSHEFKTPIASINGFASLLLEGGLSEEERQQALRVIVDESARLSRLSESVLVLTAMESSRFTGEKKPFRLDLQIKDCVIMLEKQWSGKSIEIVSDLEQITYEGDETLLIHVWENLLSNAIKFTPENGEITVTLKRKGEAIEACVGDDGAGIPEEELPKIFDKYYQGAGAKGGNGLGLAICRRVCELCGGEISVRSKPGEGSQFTVTLR